MGKKILVVDDDLETVRLVGLILEREGYEITAARSGEQALLKTHAERPDLVVLDVMMPEMDGYEVTRRLRADPHTAHIPILLFTAKTSLSARATGFEAGADDFLSKPIHPDELVSRVEAVLRRSSPAQPAGRRLAKNTIPFLGCKGGVGTTTLAVNAAVALATHQARRREQPDGSDEKPIILAELRCGMATAALQLGLPRRNGLGAILKRAVPDLDAEFVEAQLSQHRTGLQVLDSDFRPLGRRLSVPPDHAVTVTNYLGQLGRYVLIDLGVGLDEANQRVLNCCRRVVVTIEPETVALALAEELLSEMNDILSIPQHRVLLAVIKRSRSAAYPSNPQIEERLHRSIVGTIPPAPELAFQASGAQEPMVMMPQDSLVVQQYRTFAQDLIATL